MNLSLCFILIILICFVNRLVSLKISEIKPTIQIQQQQQHQQHQQIQQQLLQQQQHQQQNVIYQKYRLPNKELKENCFSNSDCRTMAYICTDEDLCECAEGYKPDDENKTCIGAIERGCMYDSHCIAKAYCKGQTICTCKEEFPLISEDKWSCRGLYDSKGNQKPLIMFNVFLSTFTAMLKYCNFM